MLVKHPGLDKICTITVRIVGAITDRPPKNVVFRISRREIPKFSPYGDGRITILTDTQQEEIPVTGDGMVFVLSLPVLAAAVLLLMLKRKPR